MSDRNPLVDMIWNFTSYWDPSDIRSLQVQLKTLDEDMERKGLSTSEKTTVKERLLTERHDILFERERVSLESHLLTLSLRLPIGWLRIQSESGD